MRASSKNRRTGGFTLVEIMIAVAIIGIIATMAIPAFVKARTKSSQTAFINDLRIFSDAADYYALDTGNYFEDSATGVLPTGLSDFIDNHTWTRRTPIGGQWDSEFLDTGITSGLGVHFLADPNPGDSFMTQIDREYDDGNLASGSFRKIAGDRYYYVMAE